MSDKLDLKIICRLFAELAFVLKTFINSFKSFIVLTNSYILLNSINYIFIINKQLYFLKDKRVKVIRGN
jgi:hypothetical protein